MAQNADADLASFLSLVELQDALDFLQQATTNGQVWVGGTIAPASPVQWVDGTPLEAFVLPWAEGEPAISVVEECLILNTRNGRRNRREQLETFDCSRSRAALCMVDADQ
jgi:hypothetical protein